MAGVDFSKRWEEIKAEVSTAFAGIKSTEKMPKPSGKPFDVTDLSKGGAGAAGERSAITGVAEFWNMMQQGQETDLAEAQLEEQKATVKHLIDIQKGIGGLTQALLRGDPALFRGNVSVFNPAGV